MPRRRSTLLFCRNKLHTKPNARIGFNNPYKFSSDDLFFQVYAIRNEVTKEESDTVRTSFFSKGQPCFRASPLTKTHGFGVHSDERGKVAIYGMETAQYDAFVNDPSMKKVKAMRTSKK